MKEELKWYFYNLQVYNDIKSYETGIIIRLDPTNFYNFLDLSYIHEILDYFHMGNLIIITV